MHHAVTLEALRVLQAIDEKGSFAAAADALFKVPSALTYTVQKLESDLGVSLFDRKGQKAIMTSAGRMLLKDGRELLLATSRLEQKVRQVESGWETHITIAKDTIIPDEPLFNVLSEFCQMDKQVEFSIVDEALGGGWDALYSQRADIAIGVTGDVAKGVYNLDVIGEVEFVFAVSNDHPLADFVGIVEANHISEFPAIIVADSSRTLPQRSSGLFESKQQIRVGSMASKVQAQRQGLGVGFLPLHMAKPWLDSGELVAKATSIPRPPIPVYMAYEKGKDGRGLKWLSEKLAQVQWI